MSKQNSSSATPPSSSTLKRKRSNIIESSSEDSDDGQLGLRNFTSSAVSDLPSFSSLPSTDAPFPAAYTSSSKQKPRHRLLDQNGRPIKKSKLENASCRDLVQAFRGKFNVTTIPTVDEILTTVACVIPSAEFELYSSWFSSSHRPATVDNVLQSESYLTANRSPNIELYLRAVDKRREHDLGRNHTAPAVFWMLMAAILIEHSCSDKFVCTEESFREFEREFPILIAKAKEYNRMTNFHRYLHKAHTFLQVLFKLIPLNGFLEVCLLIVSCLEARGKHHQRSGRNRPFPARAYRYLIERIGEKPDIDPELLAEFEVDE